MSGLLPLMAEVYVTGVQFNETSIEVQFMEQREQTRKVAMMKTMMIDLADEPERMVELQELLCELIDDGYVALRNPPTRVHHESIRERMVQSREAAGGDAPMHES